MWVDLKLTHESHRLDNTTFPKTYYAVVQKLPECHCCGQVIKEEELCFMKTENNAFCCLECMRKGNTKVNGMFRTLPKFPFSVCYDAVVKLEPEEDWS